MDTLRKITVLAAFLAFVAAGAISQTKPDDGPALGEFRKDMKSLALEDKEIEALEKIMVKNDDDLTKAQAEIKILQAKLERLMLEKKPPMDDIKAIVKQSLEWEYKIRIVRIERNMEIRAVIGDERWAKAYRLAKIYAQMKRTGKIGDKDLDPKTMRQFKFLEALQ